MDTLKIAATAHIINYLPEYHARAAGFLAERDLEVVATPQDPWTRVLDDLDAGTSDLALCGLWVPQMFAGIRDDAVVVGQLNARCPMAIVTREPVDGFTLEWLLGHTLLIPGYTGTVPYVFTAGLLREAGLDPSKATFVRDLSRETLLQLYGAGVGDAILVDMLTAHTLQQKGSGTISYFMADGGPMANSVYLAHRDRVAELRDPITRFLAAIEASMQALSGGKPDEVDDLLAAQWPQAQLPVVREAAAVMMGDGTWEGVRLDPAATVRMARMVHEAGLSLRVASYEDLVDESCLPVPAGH